jgi:hypothetical protein
MSYPSLVLDDLGKGQTVTEKAEIHVDARLKQEVKPPPRDADKSISQIGPYH